MTTHTMSIDTATYRDRIAGEYFEMPGLKLRSDQAARLFGIDRTTAQRLLDELCDRRVLVRTCDGAYRLPD
jgi:DNA-binding IclR family transcriptional regulator